VPKYKSIDGIPIKVKRNGALVELICPDYVSMEDFEEARAILHEMFGAQHHVEQHARNGRRRLPDTRRSITHKFQIDDQEGYFTIGLYTDGTPGELFITAHKTGSSVQGLLESFGIMVSMSLQYGVPLEDIARKMIGARFEPSGRTQNPEIRNTFSIVDYIFRWISRQFAQPKSEAQVESEVERESEAYSTPETAILSSTPSELEIESGVFCPDCSAPLVATEGCLKCYGCGFSKC
jgi:ribonucleoside-diphosphate reductase alpha chain